MEFLGYFFSVLIGVSLGLIGSGGSILTVPVLVYLMRMDPLLATTSSLFIVGATSLVGGLRALFYKIIDSRAVISFGLPSVISIFITRHYILPVLPEKILTIGNFILSKEMFLMVFFAILMLLSSISMIRNKSGLAEMASKDTKHDHKIVPLILLGLLVGFVTGLLGAGGGFLIIPSLVIFLGLPMKKAIGTSLLIIAINSLLGFLFSLNQFSYNWMIILLFTGLSIIGLFIGNKLSEYISGKSLKKGFGWFVLVMGTYIIIKEFFFPGV
ncbi:MAG TPA: sulfite exporter TauE/SafE family protein [Chitinophagaceae bacterium]|nr:sulfite exporter TauE/SafE family protein [Chitinophagaceae bacterium]